MSDQIDDLTESAKTYSQYLEKAHKSAEGIHLSFGKVLTYGVGLEALKNAFDHVIKQTTGFQSLTKVLSSENRNVNKLIDVRSAQLRSQHEDSLAISAGRIGSKTEEEAMLEVFKRQNNALKAQIDFAQAFKATNKAVLIFGAAAIGTTVDLILKNLELNRALVDANTSYETRRSILMRTVATQIQLGASFSTVSEGARELVKYGMETESSFGSNLKIITQMHDGLNVSAAASAHLAVVVERQLKGSFQSVADVVAGLVENTALAGEEAVKLATSLGQTIAKLGSSANSSGIAEVTKIIGRYEGAVKELGGAPGGFEELFKHLLSAKGVGLSGMLGVQQGSLGSGPGAQAAMDSFFNFVETRIKGLSGGARLQQLDNLAHIFGMSAEQLNVMLQVMERTQTAQYENIDLQKRWRDQLKQSSSGFERLGNSILGLMQFGLTPVVGLFGALANAIAYVIEMVTECEPVLYVAAAAMSFAMLVAGKSMFSLVRLIYSSVVATNFLAAGEERLAAIRAAAAAEALLPEAASGAGMFASMAGFFTSALFLEILVPIGLLAVAIGALTVVMNAIADQQKRDELQKQRLLATTITAEEQIRNDIAIAVRYGSANEQMEALTAALVYANKSAEGRGIPVDQRTDYIKKYIEDTTLIAGDILAQGLAARQMSITTKTPEEKQTEEQTLLILAQLLEISKAGLDVAMARNKIDAETAKEEEKQERIRTLQEIKQGRGRWNIAPGM